MRCPRFILSIVLGIALPYLGIRAQVDANGNNQSDIWERVYNARDLPAAIDSDGDGYTNEQESIVGTDPLDPNSKLELNLAMSAGGGLELRVPTPSAKTYEIYHKSSLAESDWTLIDTVVSHEAFTYSENQQGAGFYRVRVAEADSDGDGVTDWEEIELGFNPDSANTERFGTGDQARINAALSEASVIDLQVIEDETHENWPDPAVIAVRRTGGLDPITVELAYGGTASGSDYVGPSTSIDFSTGQRIAYLNFTPTDDALSESAETVTIDLIVGTGYELGTATSTSISIIDSNEGVSSHEAHRLLAQTTFGATAAEVASVQTLGIEGWIDAQMALPASNLLQTATEAAEAAVEDIEQVDFHGNAKLVGWWDIALNAPDQLRQRVAFALSQILVVSDDAGMIDGQPVGMANYYDILLRNAFGNYRDILNEVTYHPVMGIYLSHKGNEAPDPSIGRFPDENYAREIMQLFTIGLWELNQDGTRRLDNEGLPISTYSNFEISELARVFTGMNWGTNDPLNHWQYSRWPSESIFDPYTVPMQFWEGREFDIETEEWLPYRRSGVDFYFRDRGSKQLVDGTVIPEGQLGEQDVEQALDVLFSHQNVGPFIARLLIQRLIKSNPSPQYIGRVASAFNDNGSGVRGDMAAVIKAILMDPEARNFSELSSPVAGKQREPYLRMIHYARTFGATSSAGPIVVFWKESEFQQTPLSSPTVFNFFTPDYAPPGEISRQGLTAPEFEVTTTVSATRVPNEFEGMTRNQYIGWHNEHYMPFRPYTDISEEIALLDDPAALVAHLDDKLCYGTLKHEQHTIITDAVQRAINSNRPDEEVAGHAIYFVMTSPDYVIQK